MGRNRGLKLVQDFDKLRDGLLAPVDVEVQGREQRLFQRRRNISDKLRGRHDLPACHPLVGGRRVDAGQEGITSRASYVGT